MEKNQQLFDAYNFSKEMKEKRFNSKLSLKEICSILKISKATLYRLESCHIPEVFNYYLCCKWLCVSMDKFFKS